ncbi:MAG: carbamoyltransferase HypF, partial [Magnetococcales bacterium]|nr:carbamoyltransferase HypF [Magnetococcales bacterium]
MASALEPIPLAVTDGNALPEVLHACAIRVGGRVQGVGFRPFLYRLAMQHGIRGWVCNVAGEVVLHAQGRADRLQAFKADIVLKAPPLARPDAVMVADQAVDSDLTDFTIRSSRDGSADRAHVPPDQFVCDDCLEEMADPQARRFRYPFTNCTQCGPRFTVIDRLPYDRPNTAMDSFTLCPACRAEYDTPADRRFHAQPLACPVCGPRLTYRVSDQGDRQGEEALSATVTALEKGAIVAIKGVGGYHLCCDAFNAHSVKTLRQRKHRPNKPLALLLPMTGRAGLEWVRTLTRATPLHEQMLLAPERPIVLVPARPETALAPQIAPHLDEIGVMLPYSPLHHLLLNDFGRPLLATSANISGEPVLIEEEDVAQRLHSVADGFLHHDRPIRRPADDPIYRVIDNRARRLRTGRGCAPLSWTLPFTLRQPVLAVGGHMKNTVALAWANRAVLSQHIGSLESPRGKETFQRVVEDLQALYGVEVQRIVHDAHPGYPSSRWAVQQAHSQRNKEHGAVWHHHAHASAWWLESGLETVQEEGEALVFTWDGIGLGPDGTLWGGEALLGVPGAWRRVASFRPLRLVGGDRVALEPWRSAQALCWQAEHSWSHAPPSDPLLRLAWERGVNSVESHGVGRLFDAAAALTGCVTT